MREHQRLMLGDYELLEKLATCGGTVWRARDTRLDRLVTVKIPGFSVTSRPDCRARLLRDARIAAGLRHPGIAGLFEVSVHDGVPIVVFDFVEGLTLRELLGRDPPTFRAAAALAADVADALDYAHARGLLHRNITPNNIFVKALQPPTGQNSLQNAKDAHGLPGRAVITDLGLAVDDETERDTIPAVRCIGTPPYVSPEQIRADQPLDGRSDLYSLGVVLYEMLCGQPPFSGSPVIILQQVLRRNPRPPRRLNANIPRDLETICLKAMAKQPAWRYQTGAEMADDLRRFLKGEPIRARRPHAIRRAWRWCRGFARLTRRPFLL